MNKKIPAALVLLMFASLVGTSISVRGQALEAGKRNDFGRWQVGKPLPRSSLVRIGTEQYVLYMVRDGKKQPSTLLTRNVELGEQAGEPIIRITQRYESAAGVNSDTSIVRRRTLEPLTYRSTSSTQTEYFHFSPGRVKGEITPTQGEVKPFDAAIESPVFNAVILDEILKALPLAEGHAFSIHAHNPGKQFFTLILRVLRSERIHNVGNQPIDAWIVEMEGGAAPTTYWIAKQTQEVLMQKGHA